MPDAITIMPTSISMTVRLGIGLCLFLSHSVLATIMFFLLSNFLKKEKSMEKGRSEN